MSQNNFEVMNSQSEAELLTEFKNDLNQLKDEIGGAFEYKNRSRDGKYFVFSYNTIKGESINDIKQKYIKQYGGSIESILVTDARGKIINNSEFQGGEKIYLKVKMENHYPIKFVDSKESSGQTQKSCIISNPGWDSASISQIYQDEFDVVIEKDRLNITDKNGNIYDENHKFEIGETVIITIKKESNLDSMDKNEDNSEKIDNEDKYKEMIENQKSPLTHGNRDKPEVSITFDDGHGPENIEHILDTLKGSEIKATFFIVGTCIKATPDLWKRAIKEGHQICCHTYSHVYLNNVGDITSFDSNLNQNIELDGWVNNVKNLLGEEYYKNLKLKAGAGFPNEIKSDLLLETEILMREAQVKKTLGEDYLKTLKQDYPFFRFTGGCGAGRPKNIAVLKRLGYLSIGWSDDFYRGSGKSRKHMSVEGVKNIEIENGDIPLFHFKQDDYKYIDAYINNLKSRNKTGKKVSDII